MLSRFAYDICRIPSSPHFCYGRLLKPAVICRIQRNVTVTSPAGCKLSDSECGMARNYSNS